MAAESLGFGSELKVNPTATTTFYNNTYERYTNFRIGCIQADQLLGKYSVGFAPLLDSGSFSGVLGRFCMGLAG